MNGDKLDVNGNVYGVTVAQNGSVFNQTLILPENKTPKQLTSKLGKTTIIGRKKELKEIEHLLDSSSTLLISGIGGIGKSTIASYYLYSKKENLDYYGFFEGLESFISELRKPLSLQYRNENDTFIDALSRLRTLKGNKLLVFDDVKEIETNRDKIERILALKDSGYKIILTSREEIEDIKYYYLDVLSLADARELFKTIYKVKDEILLEEVLKYVDYHAFFVEKIAQTLKNKKGLLTLEEIKKKFNNHQFTDIRFKKKKSFNQLLKELFTFNKLEENEILLLKQLSVLPSINMELDSLFKMFQVDDRIKFQENLEYLSEKGLLIPNPNGYKLHQIIKEYILENHLPELHEIKKIFDYINKESDIQREYILSFYFVMKLIEKKKIIFWSFISNIFKFTIIERAIFISKFIVVEKIFDKKLIYNEIVKIFDFFNSVACTYFYQGEYKKSLDIYIKYKRKYIQMLGEVEYYLGDKYQGLAQVYEKLNKKENELNLYEKALKIKKQYCGKECLKVASSYHELAVYYRKNEKYKKSIKYFEKSLKMKLKLGEEDSSIANTYNSLGVLYNSMKDNQKSLEMYQKSLRLYSKIDNEDRTKALIYNNLGIFYLEKNNYKKAFRFLNKSLKIKKEILGEKHPDTAESYNNLASLYKSQGEYSKAEPFYKKALKIREEILGEKHPDTATSYNNLASLYELQKEYSKAESLYKKALKITGETFEENHPDTAESYNNLASLYKSQGEYSKAEPFYKKALKIREEIFGENHPDIAESYNNLASLYYLQGEYSKSESLFKKALKIEEEILEDNHSDIVVISYNSLAVFYYSVGEYKMAKKLLEKCITITIVEKLDYSPINMEKLKSVLDEVEKNLEKESD